MKFLIIVFIVVVVGGYVNGDKELTADDQQYILDEHNRVRADTGASNMYKLVWDSELATKMQTLVGTCKFEHTPDIDRKWGENIAMINFPNENYMNSNYFKGPTKIDFLVTKGIGSSKSWVQEKVYVTDTDFTCTWLEGETNCGHYTQVVWAKSAKLGCAAVNCPEFLSNGVTETFVWFLACAYREAGNYRNQKAFETGVECSACNPGDTCEDKLCIAS